jgi:DNA-binding NarL/FixJ family response regulator
MSIRIAITDDHPLVIVGLKQVLGLHPRMQVIAEFSSGTALLEGIELAQPDILLLDVQLPDIQGPELARTISKKYPRTGILALTSLDNVFHAKTMLQHGCLGYLLKNSDPAILVEAIEHVHRGEQFLEPSIREELLLNLSRTKKQAAGLLPQLTRREKEILQLIVAEHTNQEIADKLFLSERTVKNHRMSLLHKLNVKNSIGLARIALELGLV